MQEKINELEKDVAVIKYTTSNILKGMEQVTDALKDNSEKQSQIIGRLDIYDMREEQRNKDFEHMRDDLTHHKKAFYAYKDDHKELLDRVNASHKNMDDFKKGMTSTSGKITIGVIFVFLAWLIGIDLSNLKL